MNTNYANTNYFSVETDTHHDLSNMSLDEIISLIEYNKNENELAILNALLQILDKN